MPPRAAVVGSSWTMIRKTPIATGMRRTRRTRRTKPVRFSDAALCASSVGRKSGLKIALAAAATEKARTVPPPLAAGAAKEGLDRGFVVGEEAVVAVLVMAATTKLASSFARSRQPHPPRDHPDWKAWFRSRSLGKIGHRLLCREM